MKTTTWILPDKAGRRFRQGHPWVFANELAASPKGLEPGAPVELREARGQLLARGYGNPHSLICFRALSRKENEIEPWSEKRLAEKVVAAARWREQLGLKKFSHRMVFGEADDLPGVVLDRFVNCEADKQVLVLQILTAGIERYLGQPGQAVNWAKGWVESVTGLTPEQTTLIIRRDVGARKLEGLEMRPPEILALSEGATPVLGDTFPAWVRAADHRGVDVSGGLTFHLDLIGGQKTGFFFDQASNLEMLVRMLPLQESGTVRILDLFCYVGQWGTQLARVFKNSGAQPEVHLVDASASALALAQTNAKQFATQAYTYELDILEGLSGIPDCEIVICDPPAFIKSKKDHGPGLRGYLKANTMAMKKVKPGGWFVSCSCSHHLSDSDMVEMLRQAEAKSFRQARWLGRGVQAPDHPVRLNFPEGQYLKAWIAQF